MNSAGGYRNKVLHLAVWLLSLGVVALATQPREGIPVHMFQHEWVLGTSMELKLTGASTAEAEAGERAALAEIRRLSGILSTYDSGSEVSRWLRTVGVPVQVSEELFNVLDSFDSWRRSTGGALDAAAGVVSQVWKSAASSNRIPTDQEVAQAVQRVAQQHWRLNPAERTATHLSDAPLAMNTFVKSYIINKAADAARKASNARAVVLNIGGDLVVRGDLDEPVWISDPLNDAENAPPAARVRVRNLAVATSGGYRRGVQIGNTWYSHLVDPRTARPVNHILSATVLAPNAVDGGALATALCVLQPEESLKLIQSVPGAECLLLASNGRRIVSTGWSRFEIAAAPAEAMPAAKPTTGGSTWNSSMELQLNFEIARQPDERSRRPYVAAWIEDKDKFPVRTLALWFKGDRWLPDLRGWYRGDQLRSLAEGRDLTASVSSATRPAGKYTLKWDGKDNAGQWVKPGKYTVYLEAAREHGTYQLMKQEMDFNGSPAHFDIKGNAEISSASLDYHRK